MKQSIYIFIFLLSLSTISIGQSVLKNTLDTLYGNLKEEGKPGLSISIVKNGKTIFSEGYGLANLEHQIPFTSSTISDLGSVSKQITAFAIIMLHDQGKLNIDENIRTYLDDLPPLGSSVTVKHLIHHTSGIPDIYSLHALKGMRAGDHVSQGDAIMFMQRNPRVDFIPGSRYRYSNTAYMFLAEIIKKVTGKEFETWMQDNIFRPLEMNNTGIMNIQGEIFPGMADGYNTKDGQQIKIYDNSTLQGGGGVYSTGDDMIKWIDNFRTRKIGNKNVFTIFLQQAILNDGTKINYAGGINVDEYRGINRNTHNGSSAGYRTKMAYYPDYNLGFMVKSNTPSIGYDQFNKIEDVILESLLASEILPQKTDNKVEVKKQETSLSFLSDEYEGNFFCQSLDFTVKVKVQGGTLLLTNFFYDFPVFKPMGNDLFKNNGNELKFQRNKKGEVESLSITTPRASNIAFTKNIP